LFGRKENVEDVIGILHKKGLLDATEANIGKHAVMDNSRRADKAWGAEYHANDLLPTLRKNNNMTLIQLGAGRNCKVRELQVSERPGFQGVDANTLRGFSETNIKRWVGNAYPVQMAAVIQYRMISAMSLAGIGPLMSPGRVVGLPVQIPEQTSTHRRPLQVAKLCQLKQDTLGNGIDSSSSTSSSSKTTIAEEPTEQQEDSDCAIVGMWNPSGSSNLKQGKFDKLNLQQWKARKVGGSDQQNQDSPVSQFYDETLAPHVIDVERVLAKKPKPCDADEIEEGRMLTGQALIEACKAEAALLAPPTESAYMETVQDSDEDILSFIVSFQVVLL
jgi:hypothetical protein